MLQTDQSFPRISSQVSGVVANPDTSVDIYCGPRRRPARSRTGCRPFPARAGSSFCGSTARSMRGSTRNGSPEKWEEMK